MSVTRIKVPSKAKAELEKIAVWGTVGRYGLRALGKVFPKGKRLSRGAIALFGGMYAADLAGHTKQNISKVKEQTGLKPPKVEL